jgi:TolB-like protein
MAAALLVLAVGGLIGWRLLTPGPARPADQNGRVDVMRFEAQSPDPAATKVAADVSESLVRELADAGQPVAERPLTRDGAGGDAEVRIAGTVEQEGSTIIVQPQILDRKSGTVLWTDRFERTPRQQQTAPGEVANQVAAVLHCALQDRKVASTPISTEAFSLYLNACAGIFVHEGSWGRMLAATRLLVKAAPSFANAHAMRAIAAANSANEAEHSPAEAAALHAEARAAADQALQLDPRTPKAYVALAWNEGVLTDQPHQNRRLAEQYLLKGLGIDPDLPPLRHGYGTLLRATGRTREAIELIRASSAARDPRGGADPNFALLLAAGGDLAGAEAALRDIEVRSRGSEDASRFTIALWWDDPRAGQAGLRTLAAPDAPKTELDCYDTYLRSLSARGTSPGRGLPASCQALDLGSRARLLAREGDVDGAFAALKPPVPGGAAILYYPEMKAVRADPRFWPLAKSLGLTDYWLASGHWPDFCAEPGLDCRKAALAAGAAR